MDRGKESAGQKPAPPRADEPAFGNAAFTELLRRSDPKKKGAATEAGPQQQQRATEPPPVVILAGLNVHFTAMLEQARTQPAPGLSASFTATLAAAAKAPAASAPGGLNSPFSQLLAAKPKAAYTAPVLNAAFTRILEGKSAAKPGGGVVDIPGLNSAFTNLLSPKAAPAAKEMLPPLPAGMIPGQGPALVAASPEEVASHNRVMEEATQKALEAIRNGNLSGTAASDTFIREVSSALGEKFTKEWVRDYAYRWFMQNWRQVVKKALISVAISVLLNAALPGLGFSALKFLADPAIGGGWGASMLAGLLNEGRGMLKDVLVNAIKKRIGGIKGSVPDVNLLGARPIQDTLAWLGVSEDNRRVMLSNVLSNLAEGALMNVLRGKIFDQLAFGGVNWYVPTVDLARWRGFGYSTVASATLKGANPSMVAAMRQLGNAMRRIAMLPVTVAVRLKQEYDRRGVIRGRARQLVEDVNNGVRQVENVEEFATLLGRALEQDAADPEIVRASQEAFAQVVGDSISELEVELDRGDTESPVSVESMEIAAERPAPPPAVEAEQDSQRFRFASAAVATSLASAAVTLTGALVLSRMAPGNFEAAGEVLAPLGGTVNSMMRDMAANSGVRIEALFYQLLAQGLDLDKLILQYAGKIPLWRIAALQELRDRIREAGVFGAENSRFSRELISIMLGERYYTRQELLRLDAAERAALFKHFYEGGAPATPEEIINAIVRAQQDNVRNLHASIGSAITRPIVAQAATSALAATVENGYAAARGLYASFLDHESLAQRLGISELGRRSLLRLVTDTSLDPLGAFQPGAAANAAMQYMEQSTSAAVRAAVEAKRILDAWLASQVSSVQQQRQPAQQLPVQPLTQRELADARAVQMGYENSSAMNAAIAAARESNRGMRMGGVTYENYGEFLRNQAEEAARAAQRDEDRAREEAERARDAYQRREAELAAARAGEWQSAAEGRAPLVSPAQRAFEQARRHGEQVMRDAAQRAADIRAANPTFTDEMIEMLSNSHIIGTLIVDPSGVAAPTSAQSRTQGSTPAYQPSAAAPKQQTSFTFPPPMSMPDMQPQVTPARAPPVAQPAGMAPVLPDLEGMHWQPFVDTATRQGLERAEDVGAAFLGNLATGALAAKLVPAATLINPLLGAATAAGLTAAAFVAPSYRAAASSINRAADIYSITRAVVQATNISPDSTLGSLPEIRARLPEVPSLVSWLYGTETVQHMERTREIDVQAAVAGEIAEYTAAALTGNRPAAVDLFVGIANRLVGPATPGLVGLVAPGVAQAVDPAAEAATRAAARALARSMAYIAGVAWDDSAADNRLNQLRPQQERPPEKASESTVYRQAGGTAAGPGEAQPTISMPDMPQQATALPSFDELLAKSAARPFDPFDLTNVPTGPVNRDTVMRP